MGMKAYEIPFAGVLLGYRDIVQKFQGILLGCCCIVASMGISAGSLVILESILVRGPGGF